MVSNGGQVRYPLHAICASFGMQRAFWGCMLWDFTCIPCVFHSYLGPVYVYFTCMYIYVRVLYVYFTCIYMHVRVFYVYLRIFVVDAYFARTYVHLLVFTCIYVYVRIFTCIYMYIMCIHVFLRAPTYGFTCSHVVLVYSEVFARVPAVTTAAASG